MKVKTKKVKFLILGAGVAGLGASLKLKEKGVESTILEKENTPGGLNKSFNVSGCDFDFGPKILLLDQSQNSKKLLGFLERNYKKYPVVERTYLSKYGLLHFPLQRYLVELPKKLRLKILSEIEKTSKNPGEEQSSDFKKWLVAKFGQTFCRLVLFPYETKKWQTPLEKMDYKWALKRPVNVDYREMVSGSTTLLPPKSHYFYPKKGNISTLTKMMAKRAEKIIYNCDVQKINLKQKIVETSNGKFNFKSLISSLPLDYTVKITKDLAREIRVLASQNLKHVGILLFALVFETKTLPEGTAIYFPEKKFCFRRVSVINNLCPALGRKNTVSLLAEIPLIPLKKTNVTLEKVISDLKHVKTFEKLGKLVDWKLEKIDFAYPLQTNKRNDTIKKIQRYYAKFNIFFCGRGGNFDYCNSDIAFKQGQKIAEKLLRKDTLPKTVNHIIKNFKRERIVPFWMWNDKLKKDKIINQLREIKNKGMNQTIIHPRFGLESYLTSEWFQAFSWALKEAEKLKMGVWIYDELNWPSGYAGGLILKKHPKLISKHITKIKNRLKVESSNWKPAYSKSYYTNLLEPKTTELFLKYVHKKYWQKFKKYFGKTILGFFTDEPGIYNNFAGIDKNSLPWSSNLPSYFKKKFGYELLPALKSTWKKDDQESIETRINFWTAITELYQENYFKTIQKWCHQHKVAFIGHILAEESLVDTVKTQGDFFQQMKFLDFTGYDLIGRLQPKTIIAAKLALSAKKLFKQEGVCAETFGIFGWELTFKEMKKIAKWQFEQGLDVLIPHALYYSTRGDRKNDCPPSFFHSKYWQSFKQFVEYIHSLEKKIPKKKKVAIYYPIETVWGYLSPVDSSKANLVNEAFKIATYTCYNLGFDFEYLNNPAVLQNKLSNYSVLILPRAEILPLKTLQKIIKFGKQGKVIISLDGLPKFATERKDQNIFRELIKNNKNLFYKIDLSTEQNQKAIVKLLISLKNKLFKHISPIWTARALRLGKILKLYSTFENLKQKTGIEKELSDYLITRSVVK